VFRQIGEESKSKVEDTTTELFIWRHAAPNMGSATGLKKFGQVKDFMKDLPTTDCTTLEKSSILPAARMN